MKKNNEMHTPILAVGVKFCMKNQANLLFVQSDGSGIKHRLFKCTFLTCHGNMTRVYR